MNLIGHKFVRYVKGKGVHLKYINWKDWHGLKLAQDSFFSFMILSMRFITLARKSVILR